MRHRETVKKIVQNLQICLYDVEEDHEYREQYIKNNGRDYLINSSFIYGSDEIVLGIYDNPEFKLASFFHEIGHIFISKEFKAACDFQSVPIERQAWEIGFAIAKTYGIYFGEETYAWAENRIESYKTNENE